MHELSVMTYLLERVELHAESFGARKVLAINLVIGEQASIVDDSLLFAFDLLTPGTVAEGAKLIVRRTETKFACDHCEETFRPVGGSFFCPRCGALGRATGEGSELLIESLEYEA